MFRRLFLLSFVLLTFGFFSNASAATYVVDRADDAAGANACTAAANDCSLRGAMNNANSNGAGTDTINFNIAGSGVKTVTLASTLPEINSSLTINGATQAGYFGKPMIEVNGNNVNSYGFNIDTPMLVADISVTIIGLAINRHLYGVYSDCFARCDITLLGNFIGTNANGTAALPNGGDGVYISPNGTIVIGGEGLFEGNLISGNGNVGSGNSGAGINISPGFNDASFAGTFYVFIKGNKIGTNYDGNADLGNADNGIFVSEFNNGGGDVVDLNLIIGGANAAARNVVSGNKENGIDIRCKNATIIGNYIGTNSAGNAAIGNGILDSFFADYGIYIQVQNGANYQIGSGETGEGNVISGNNGNGVYLSTGSGGSGAAQLAISGNFIGTNADGTIAVGNKRDGISIDSSTNYTLNATIGGITANARNIISGNDSDGVSLGSGNISLHNNYIGTNKTGTGDLGNGIAGARVIYDANVKIGGTISLLGTDYDVGNLISGNNGNGIEVSTLSNLPVVIRRNYIGTNAAGTGAIPNAKNGIYVSNLSTIIGSDINAADGNVISGNGEDGIYLDGTGQFAVAQFTKIYGNTIGTNSIGGDFLPNGQNGIEINASPNNRIGLAGNDTAINIVSGNNERGIYISGANSSGNKIENNIVGAGSTGGDLGNQESGIEIFNANQNFVGSASGTGNTIAFNQKGVWIRSGNNNAIRRNSISSNDQLGIDLGAAGVTANDAGDADTGANNLQNFPVLTAANQNNIAGSLNSMPNASYDIDFYRVDSCDASGSGEGRYFVGTTSVSTDASGNAQFNLVNFSVLGQTFTATASVSDSAANPTSEFSACIVVTPPTNILLSASTYSVNEGAATRTIVVNRTGGTNIAVTVNYTTSDGTATAGQDYTATNGTLSFGIGEVVKTFDVSINNDTIDEMDETINIALSSPTGGAFLTVPNIATLTIIDNDNAPTISIADISQMEGNSGTTNFVFSIQLSAASGQNIAVNFTTLDGTANAPADYLATNGIINFAAGENLKTVLVTVNGDMTQETNETFYVQLTNPTNSTIADNQGVGLILDDDGFGGVSVGGTIKKSDNTPLFGATINLTGTQTAQMTTDANGRYSFQNLQSGGNYTVSPSTVNYIFAPQNLQFTNLTSDVANADFTATYTPPRQIVMISGSTTPGQNGAVTTELEAKGDENKVAFSLSYDQTILSNPQVALLPDAQTANAFLTVDNSISGKVGVSITLPAGQVYAAGPLSLVAVTFNTMPTNASNTPIIFDDTPTARKVFDLNSNELSASYIDGVIFFEQGYEADIAPHFNGDGSILSNDVIQVRRFFNQSQTPDSSTNEFQRADSSPYATKGDGIIASDDVVQTRRYQNGTNPQQTAGGPTTNNFAANKSPQENASFTRAAGRALRVENAVGSLGQQVIVNIRVDATGDEAEYGFSLNYDPTILTDPVVGTSDVGAAVRSCAVAPFGSLNCSVGGFPNNLPGSGDAGIGEMAAGNNQILLRVSFTVAADADSGDSALTLSNGNASSAAPQLYNLTTTDGTVIIMAAPTAAMVTVSGKVLTGQGRGVRNAMVMMTDADGNVRTTTTSTFGYYQFTEVPAGKTCVFNVSHKLYQFTQPSLVLTIIEDAESVNFVAVQ